MTREVQLPIADALGIVRDVASALAYAHQEGVIHRDIKPENILLHESEPMVADFGLALAVAAGSDNRLTQTGLAVGTPAYMSPEQAFGDQEPDGRSDVYSLACVLFEMLVGETPFVGPTPMSVLAKRLVDPAPSVRRLRASVPGNVDQAIMKALAKVPAERFPTASAFAEALVAPVVDRRTTPVVAVMPFLSLSADPDTEYFADGITEDVIMQLSKLRTLDVISRTSVMQFKARVKGIQEIAATLHAGALLDGSVRRAGNRVRIVAQLIDARTEQHLWAETYDRELTDIFAIQTDVALQIAAALNAELTHDERSRLRREPTKDVEAYQLYLQGRRCQQRYTPEGLAEALRFFERAVGRDPQFALAHTAVAFACIEIGEGGHAEPAPAFARARTAITRALELDPELAEAHCASGYFAVVSDFDWVRAEQSFNRALVLTPGLADAWDLYGRICAAQGRFEEALTLIRRAYDLDPVAARSDVVNALLRAGRFAEALETARKAVTLDPLYDRGHMTLGWANQRMGLIDDAFVAFRRAMTLSPDSSQWLAQYGEALALTGRSDDARATLRKLTSLATSTYVSPYHFAYVYTGLGEFDTAIELLERAFAERTGAVYGIKGSFLFAPLREHPRFVALLRKMNLA